MKINLKGAFQIAFVIQLNIVPASIELKKPDPKLEKDFHMLLIRAYLGIDELEQGEIFTTIVYVFVQMLKKKNIVKHYAAIEDLRLFLVLWLEQKRSQKIISVLVFGFWLVC